MLNVFCSDIYSCSHVRASLNRANWHPNDHHSPLHYSIHISALLTVSSRFILSYNILLYGRDQIYRVSRRDKSGPYEVGHLKRYTEESVKVLHKTDRGTCKRQLASCLLHVPLSNKISQHARRCNTNGLAILCRHLFRGKA